MASFSITSIAKSYGGRDLFTGLSLDVPDGARLAVIGPNGYGKSTLLRILAGEMQPDVGQVSLVGGTKVGYSAQELDPRELDQELMSWVLAAFPSWAEFWIRWEAAVAAGDEAALGRLSAEQAALEQSFGYNLEHQAETVLTGLSFQRRKFHRRLATLSGGWRERAKLARVILAGADALLLDEPTNHLDVEAVEWLEQYLLGFSGSVVFVAHDRRFLDTVATHVLHLGAAKPVLRRGNYSQYLAWREETEKTRERQAANLQAKIDDQLDYVRRFRVKARKASQAQSKLKSVERLKEELADLGQEQRRRTLSFTMPDPDPSEKMVVQAQEALFRFDDGGRLWPPLSFTIFRGQKIALLGRNGAGKSSLLKMLLGLVEPGAGKVLRGPKTTLAYFSQHQAELLDLSGTVLAWLRGASNPRLLEEQLKSVLGLFMLGEDYWDRRIESLSGGEKSRLVLASMFLAKANFLILDEPTNHLDLESREALIDALRAYTGTVLMVAHDRHLMAECASQVWLLTREGLTQYDGGWEEFERSRATVDTAQPLTRPTPEPQAAPNLGRRLEKADKRRAAEIRNEVSRELKPRKDEYARLETEFEALLVSREALEARLADPATYGRTDEFMRLTSDYQQAKAREEAVVERMAVLEEEIAACEARREAMLGEGP